MRTAALALALVAAPAGAELAPGYQRLAEFQAVLAAPAIGEAFGPATPVERVEWVKADLYRVSAGACHIDAAIVGEPLPQGMVGARRFHVEAAEKVCD